MNTQRLKNPISTGRGRFEGGGISEGTIAHVVKGLIMKNKRFKIYTLTLISASVMPYAQAGMSFIGLGDLPGGTTSSMAYGVSSDGSAVVGRSYGANGWEPFRWTRFGGMQSLGDLPGGPFQNGFAHGISGDGTIVVGRSVGINDYEAFRWSQSTGLQGLGDLPGGFFTSEAYSVSGDGAIVVGRSEGIDGLEAFRWTQAGGMQSLGDLPGGSSGSEAYGISYDGNTIVGYSVGANGWEAFRWTESGGMQGLGILADGRFSRADDVSSDGTTIVGHSDSAYGGEAFRWTEVGGMQSLGDLPGGLFYGKAWGVSGDGSITVGESSGANDDVVAFVWDEVNGMQSLRALLEDNGVNMSGWTLSAAFDISEDGRTIVGSCINPEGNYEAFVAVIPEPSSALLMIIGSGGILFHRNAKRRQQEQCLSRRSFR